MRHLLPPLVISALLLSACGGRDADPLPTPADVNNDVTTDAPAPQDISTSIGFTYDTATTKVAFNPVISEVSLPSFTLFVNSTDGTAKVTIDAASDPNPVTNAINDLDGWSTTAPMNIDFKGALSTSSVCTPYMVATGTSCAPNVFLIPLTTSETGEVLSPTSITGVNSTLLATTQVKAQAVTLETGNDSVRLEPVAPLASETMYLLAITNGLEDTSNQPVGPSAMYQILSDTADHVVTVSQNSLIRVLSNITNTRMPLTLLPGAFVLQRINPESRGEVLLLYFTSCTTKGAVADEPLLPTALSV